MEFLEASHTDFLALLAEVVVPQNTRDFYSFPNSDSACQTIAECAVTESVIRVGQHLMGNGLPCPCHSVSGPETLDTAPWAIERTDSGARRDSGPFAAWESAPTLDGSYHRAGSFQGVAYSKVERSQSVTAFPCLATDREATDWDRFQSLAPLAAVAAAVPSLWSLAASSIDVRSPGHATTFVGPSSFPGPATRKHNVWLVTLQIPLLRLKDTKS